MPKLDFEQSVAFIRAKFELIIEDLPSEQMEQMARHFAAQFEGALRDPQRSLSLTRRYDRDVLERFLIKSLLAEDVPTIRATLVRRFGCSRLTASAQAVVNAVIKRNQIKNGDEFRHVQEFLSNVENISAIGEDKYAQLDALVGRYEGGEGQAEIPETVAAVEAKPDGKVPLPAVWIVPELEAPPDDEQICPEETSLEERRRFLAALWEATLRYSVSPGDQMCSRSDLGILMGEREAPEHMKAGLKDALRDTERQIDFYTIRNLPEEVRSRPREEAARRFGYRRMGPSAVALALTALKENHYRGWMERMIVHDLLRLHPRQKLFSRADVKRLNELPLAAPPEAQRWTPPKHKLPEDLSCFRVGAVFRRGAEPYPSIARIVCCDRVEILYETPYEGSFDLALRRATKRMTYYRSGLACFFTKPFDWEWVRDEPLTDAQRHWHRPDLPLRIARTRAVSWSVGKSPSRGEFEAMIANAEPRIMKMPLLPAKRIVLIDIISDTRCPLSEVEAHEGEDGIRIIDLLWAADQLQAVARKKSSEGIGIYRAGWSKGEPMFVIGEYYDRAGLLKLMEALAVEDPRAANLTPATIWE